MRVSFARVLKRPQSSREKWGRLTRMFSFLWWHQFVHRISRSMTFHQHEKQNHGSLRFYKNWECNLSAYGIYEGQGQTGFGLGVGADEISLFEIFSSISYERGTICSTPRFSYPRCCVALRQHIPVPSVGRGAPASRPTRPMEFW